MKINKIFLLAGMVLLLLVAGFFLYVKRDIIGTWTTEEGTERLVIRHCFLTHTDKYIETKETRFYVMRNFNFEDDDFFLKPTILNRSGLLGMYEKIEYSGGRLFGSILVSDLGVMKTEFRKKWQTVATKRLPKLTIRSC